MGLIVLVTGGRNYQNKRHVWGVLKEIHENKGIDAVVHGGATGADTLAEEWADKRGITSVKFPVKQWQWDKYGKAAGPMRNQFMLDFSSPDYAVIYPGGSGTSDMASRIAAKMGVTKIRDERKTSAPS